MCGRVCGGGRRGLRRAAPTPPSPKRATGMYRSVWKNGRDGARSSLDGPCEFRCDGPPRAQRIDTAGCGKESNYTAQAAWSLAQAPVWPGGCSESHSDLSVPLAWCLAGARGVCSRRVVVGSGVGAGVRLYCRRHARFAIPCTAYSLIVCVRNSK